MAMVAKRVLVWQPQGEGDRVEIDMESVVPDVVPKEVQKWWEKEDWIYEDSTKANLAVPAGPPRLLMPLRKIQEVEAARTVPGRQIPPRPVNIS